MIPLEKILEVEKKAREHGYDTTIKNGGSYIYFSKDKGLKHYTLEYQSNYMQIGLPSMNNINLDTFMEHMEEQQQLLELAKMLQVPE